MKISVLHMNILLLIVLTLFIIYSECHIPKPKTKIKTKAVNLKSCETDEDVPVHFSIRPKRFDQTSLTYDMNLTLGEPIDSATTVHYEMWKWIDGEWKKDFINVDKNDACNSLNKILGPIWKDIMINAGSDGECPFKKGFYHLKDYSYVYKDNYNYEQIPMLSAPGRFYNLIQIKKDDKVLICVDFEIEAKQVSV